MDDSSYEKYSVDRTNAGIGDAPVSVSSGMAMELVLETPRAIAVVPLADVKDSVKMIKIDGPLPVDSGYAIHSAVATSTP